MKKPKEMQSEPSEAGILRWFTGVPIGTNPLVLKDLGLALFLAWTGMSLFLLLVQLFFGAGFTGEQMKVFLSYSNVLAAGIMIGFLVVSFVFLRNRYVVLVCLDSDGVYCESMRRGRGPFDESFHWRAFPVVYTPFQMKGIVRQVFWNEVLSVLFLPVYRVLVLKLQSGANLRIYCPDSTLFIKAQLFIQNAVSESKNVQGEGVCSGTTNPYRRSG